MLYHYTIELIQLIHTYIDKAIQEDPRGVCIGLLGVIKY